MARPRTPKGRARETAARLAVEYPGTAKELCALVHDNPFQLLGATILSAQSTDAVVNSVTPTLFARYPTACRPGRRQSRRGRGHRQVDRLLPGQDPQPDRHGQWPRGALRRRGARRHEDLVTLPGVGRKTANVVRSVDFDAPGLPVDTHVLRLSRLLGLTTKTDPVKVEVDLCAMLPAPRVGRSEPAAHPARAARLHRPQAPLRDLRPGRLLPVAHWSPPARFRSLEACIVRPRSQVPPPAPQSGSGIRRLDRSRRWRPVLRAPSAPKQRSAAPLRPASSRGGGAGGAGRPRGPVRPPAARW